METPKSSRVAPGAAASNARLRILLRIVLTFVPVGTAAGWTMISAEAATKISLCPGLTIVTAISESDGDYESIKTIETIDAENVRIRYSSERLVYDWLSADPPVMKKTLTFRKVRRLDMETASLYLQHFDDVLPETIPETTAISLSKDLFRRLKNERSAEFGIFIPFGVDKPGIDRDQHPNVYDNQMVAAVTRSNEAAQIAVTLNDQLTELPAMRIEGDFYGDKSEFFVLDDPDNPLMLKFRIGINANAPLTPDEIEQRKLIGLPTSISPDKEALQVVKIAAPCGAEEGTGGGSSLPAGGGGGTAGEPQGGAPPESAALERMIEETGHADVQTIFFSVNSAELRPESDVALAAIADVLERHADWHIGIDGHTDSQADDAYNLDLSRRRAAAVKTALVDRYAIPEARLATAGYGETRPIADNATLEGRARNRRVELVRLPE